MDNHEEFTKKILCPGKDYVLLCVKIEHIHVC